MTDIEWGAEIAVNGVRPEWLRDEDLVNPTWDDGPYNAGVKWCRVIARSRLKSIRLPSHHPYYLATSRGFSYWPGGESAPEDWDGGEVLRDNGDITPVYGSGAWDGEPGAAIGYRKRAEHPAPAIAQLTEADLAEARQAYLASKEGDSAKFYATRWELLAPDPDLTLAKSIVGDAEAIALAIKAARENGRG